MSCSVCCPHTRSSRRRTPAFRRRASRSSVLAAIDRLRDAGVLRPLTNRKRDQVWGASLILDEVEDLGARIAHTSA